MKCSYFCRITPVKLYCVFSSPENCDEALSPIIFIPGFFTSNRSFTGVRYKISKRTKRKMYAIELRNHGNSEYSNEFTLQHLVADLENFMQENNIPKAVLAGHSMGGKVAMALALKHPEKVEKLIVEDCHIVANAAQIEVIKNHTKGLKVLHESLNRLPKDLSVVDAHHMLLPYVAKMFPAMVKNFSSAKSELFMPIQKKDDGNFKWEFDMDCLLDIVNHLDDFDIDISGNPVYNGDILLMGAEKSMFRVLDDLDLFHKHFPNMECKVFENGFHTFHVEFQKLYIESVTKFIGNSIA